MDEIRFTAMRGANSNRKTKFQRVQIIQILKNYQNIKKFGLLSGKTEKKSLIFKYS